MASHDAIPHGTFPAGTTLYECDARAGDVVVIRARGRFRAARVLSVASERARLIYPAERAAALPRRPSRRREELYALVGASVAGVIRAGGASGVGDRLAAGGEQP